MPRVVRFTGPREVDVATHPAAPLGPGKVRVRTLYSGISSGTELTAYRGSNPYLTSTWDPTVRLFAPSEAAATRYPVEGWGYSEVGTVVEICADDRAPAAGDVAVGDTVWGVWGHRSEAVLPRESLRGHRLSGDVEPVVGTFVRVGAIALNAVLATQCGLGSTVAVIGQGVIGLLATHFAACSGASVVAVEPIPSRREVALAFGASDAWAPSAEVAERVREATEGRGADAVIELSGAYPGLQQAIRIAGPDARVVAAGFYQGQGDALRLGEEFHHNRIQVLACQIGSPPAHLAPRWDQARLTTAAASLLENGRPDVSRLVSHHFPVDDAARAYQLLDTSPADALQVVFDLTTEPR